MTNEYLAAKIPKSSTLAEVQEKENETSQTIEKLKSVVDAKSVIAGLLKYCDQERPAPKCVAFYLQKYQEFVSLDNYEQSFELLENSYLEKTGIDVPQILAKLNLLDLAIYHDNDRLFQSLCNPQTLQLFSWNRQFSKDNLKPSSALIAYYLNRRDFIRLLQSSTIIRFKTSPTELLQEYLSFAGETPDMNFIKRLTDDGGDLFTDEALKKLATLPNEILLQYVKAYHNNSDDKRNFIHLAIKFEMEDLIKKLGDLDYKYSTSFYIELAKLAKKTITRPGIGSSIERLYFLIKKAHPTKRPSIVDINIIIEREKSRKIFDDIMIDVFNPLSATEKLAFLPRLSELSASFEKNEITLLFPDILNWANPETGENIFHVLAKCTLGAVFLTKLEELLSKNKDTIKTLLFQANNAQQTPMEIAKKDNFTALTMLALSLDFKQALIRSKKYATDAPRTTKKETEFANFIDGDVNLKQKLLCDAPVAEISGVAARQLQPQLHMATISSQANFSNSNRTSSLSMPQRYSPILHPCPSDERQISYAQLYQQMSSLPFVEFASKYQQLSRNCSAVQKSALLTKAIILGLEKYVGFLYEQMNDDVEITSEQWEHITASPVVETIMEILPDRSTTNDNSLHKKRKC